MPSPRRPASCPVVQQFFHLFPPFRRGNRRNLIDAQDWATWSRYHRLGVAGEYDGPMNTDQRLDSLPGVGFHVGDDDMSGILPADGHVDDGAYADRMYGTPSRSISLSLPAATSTPLSTLAMTPLPLISTSVTRLRSISRP